VRGREGDSTQLRRLSSRRAALIRETGRIAVAIVPVTVFALAFSGGSRHERIVSAVVLSAIWAVSVVVGHSLRGAALTALGPRVAVGRGILIAVIVTAAASAWLSNAHLSSAAMAAIALTVFAAGAAWETFAARKLTPAVRLLLVGTVCDATNLLHDLRISRFTGYAVIGVVGDDDHPQEEDPEAPLLGSTSQLDTLITETQPDLIVLSRRQRDADTFAQLLDVAQAGFRVIHLTQFYEYAFGRVPIDGLPYDWFMGVLHLYQRRYSRVVKRVLDLVGASLSLALTWPLFPVLALSVRRTKGPLIVRQTRLGEHGKLFTIYKFRTMHADAELAGQAVWATAQDPRLTRTGSVMRRFRLDELPQLWNIVRGEMSLVGPRPERPEFLPELSDRVPYWTRRHLIKPGLTGWAQVRQGYVASAEDTATKLSYDLWYLRHRSLTVDLAILLRTLLVVLRGDRSVSRSTLPAPAPTLAEALAPAPAATPAQVPASAPAPATVTARYD
jgi:exopolysaccharide biosynthesis polyprenyl glycosylphosphotransferase